MTFFIKLHNKNKKCKLGFWRFSFFKPENLGSQNPGLQLWIRYCFSCKSWPE